MGRWIDKEFKGLYIQINLNREQFEDKIDEDFLTDQLNENFEGFYLPFTNTPFDKIFSLEYAVDGQLTIKQLITKFKIEQTRLIDYISRTFGCKNIEICFGDVEYSENFA